MLKREQDEAIQTMIATLYGVAAGAYSSERALEHLARVTASDKAFIGSFDFSTRSGRIETAFNMEDHYLSAYRDRYSRQNAWLEQSQYFQVEGLLWIGSEILPPEHLTQTEFYDLFLSPQAIFHTLHAVIRVSGDVVTHLLLSRPPEEEDFRPTQVDVCRLFARHAKHAIEAREAVNTQNLVRRGLSEIMNQRGIGAAVVGSDARPLYANDACVEIVGELNKARRLGRGDNVSGDGRPWRLDLPREIQKRIIEDSETCPATIVCEKDDGNYPVIFHIHRIDLHDAFSASDKTAFAIVALDPERAVHLDADSISVAYRLTPSEARVSALIATGERVEATAEILGITPSTARTHLKRIFEKTRTTRQAELVKLLLDTARRRPIERHFQTTGSVDREPAALALRQESRFPVRKSADGSIDD